ncbi:MAG: hypothetical protein ACRC68_00870 [Clostridium sp.]
MAYIKNIENLNLDIHNNKIIGDIPTDYTSIRVYVTAIDFVTFTIANGVVKIELDYNVAINKRLKLTDGNGVEVSALYLIDVGHKLQDDTVYFKDKLIKMIATYDALGLSVDISRLDNYDRGLCDGLILGQMI